MYVWVGLEPKLVIYMLVYMYGVNDDILCSKRSMVYACSGCESYYLQPMGKRLEDGTS